MNKNVAFKLLGLLLFMLLTLNMFDDVNAQTSKNSLVFGGMLTHFQRSGEKSDIKGFYNYPVDPGAELLYQYQLSRVFFLSSGFSYQYGRISTWKGARNRFRFGEISVPVMLKLKLIQGDKKNFFASVGFAYGKMLHLDWESPSSLNEWIDVPRKYNEHYSNNDSFADLLLGLGMSFPNSHQNEFEIAPYIKCRVKDNWMGYFRNNLYYGLKISYQLNLKRNEKL